MRTRIAVARKLTVSRDKAWEAIHRIDRLDVWFPSIATCRVEGEGVGAHRYMSLRQGGHIVDHVVDVDRTEMRLVYQRVKSPFPVTWYKGTVEVLASFDSSAVVVWTVDFESDPKDGGPVARALEAGMAAGLDGLERDLHGLAWCQR